MPINTSASTKITDNSNKFESLEQSNNPSANIHTSKKKGEYFKLIESLFDFKIGKLYKNNNSSRLANSNCNNKQQLISLLDRSNSNYNNKIGHSGLKIKTFNKRKLVINMSAHSNRENSSNANEQASNSSNNNNNNSYSHHRNLNNSNNPTHGTNNSNNITRIQQNNHQSNNQQQQSQSQQIDTPPNSPEASDQGSKACCFCWCCCCSCSCLTVRNDELRNSNSIDIKNPTNIDPPSSEEIKSWSESFDKLMQSPSGRYYFREFLRSEYSEENMLFWMACEELKSEQQNPQIVEEKARLIYEDYISILSPKEVSLDSRVREVINRNMVDPSPYTFDEAQLQIYTLMHRDSYPRFLNSQIYKKLCMETNL